MMMGSSPEVAGFQAGLSLVILTHVNAIKALLLIAAPWARGGEREAQMKGLTEGVVG